MLVLDPRSERWPRNPHGRDYVAGDIHGCYRTLDELLWSERFDPRHDRLFAVGDLVNRGPNSAETTRRLTTGQITRTVFGNHDATVLRHLMQRKWTPVFGWLGQLDRDERARLADALAELPLGVEVQTDHGPVGIVHAGVVGRDWHETRRRADACNLHTIDIALLGGRDPEWRGQPGTPIGGLSLLVTGHEALPQPDSDGYWHRIDTGAGLADLTVTGSPGGPRNAPVVPRPAAHRMARPPGRRLLGRPIQLLLTEYRSKCLDRWRPTLAVSAPPTE